MKEKYFTTEQIENQAREMIRQLKQESLIRSQRLEPNNSALLVIDMQSYFLAPEAHAYVPSAEAIVPLINELVRAYYEKKLPVIFTQHLNTAQDAGMMGVWWDDLILSENSTSEIVPEMDISEGIIVQKTQYDAFYETSLEAILLEKSVKQVVVSGVQTHLCCETTARAAFSRGFEVFFLVDGNATYNQDFHMGSLRNLAHGFATLMLSNDIQAALKTAAKN
ncbi:MAG: isochorismatase family protein [Chloroflexi bacterium]|nr:isochorismatase family protein [Chloroflexota bacterium]